MPLNKETRTVAVLLLFFEVTHLENRIKKSNWVENCKKKKENKPIWFGFMA